MTLRDRLFTIAVLAALMVVLALLTPAWLQRAAAFQRAEDTAVRGCTCACKRLN